MKSHHENPEAHEGEARDNAVAVEMAKRKQFCLTCGATHYSEICPECGGDSQDDL